LSPPRRYVNPFGQFLESAPYSERDIRPPEEISKFEASYADPHKGTKYARVGRHHTKAGKQLDVKLEISAVQFRGRSAAIMIVTDVTGIDTPHEPPDDADLVLATDRESVDACVDRVVEMLVEHGLVG